MAFDDDINKIDISDNIGIYQLNVNNFEKKYK
jgi:hypothetical protein